MIDIDKLVRGNVLKLSPYSSARDEYTGKSGTFLDANENPYGSLNRYPDPYQRELKAAVSDYKKVGQEKIFLGNGSDEIIDLCFRTFCEPGIDRVLIFTPTYGMYEVSAAINDIKVIRVPLDSDFQIDLKKYKATLNEKNIKIVFICSPNNPTGNNMNFSDVKSIIADFMGIVVIDEAYADFSDNQSFISLIDKYNNLIVMQTFSKAFGLAAARVGIAYTNPGIIKYFNKLKPPYNISKLNQQAALKKLGRADELGDVVARIRKERTRVADALGKMKITRKVYPSDANFLLIEVKDANSVYNTLIRKSIIIRNRTSIIDNCLRITIGKKSENDLLIKTMKTIEL